MQTANVKDDENTKLCIPGTGGGKALPGTELCLQPVS